MKVIIPDIDITHISTILPENVLNLESLSAEYGEAEVNKIIKTTGIRKVRYASEGITSSDLCEQLTKILLKQNVFKANDIDGLIFVSQTRDHILPQTSNILQHKLELPESTACFDLPLGCSGYIYGLFHAAMLIQSSACKKVLLLAGDTTSRMINKKDRTVSMVFGDAASATIIEKGKNKMGCIIYSDGSGAKDLIVPAGAFRIPANNDTAEEKEFEGKIFRSQNDLFMDGMQIMSFSLLRVPPLIKESVEMMNWEVDNVDQYLFHQANDFMVGYLRKKLKLPETKVPMAVTEYGNTGPSSIPLTISDKFYSKELNLHRVIMCGFGVGLSWGSICTNLNQTNIYKPYIFNQHEY